jgi:hypothetical protein
MRKLFGYFWLLEFAFGGAVWLVVLALDIRLAHATFPHWMTVSFQVGFAGIVWASVRIGSFPARLSRYSYVAVTGVFGLWLVPMLIGDPQVSARALILFYALLLAGAWRAGAQSTPSAPTRWARLGDYFDAMPHAIFVLLGVCLLILVPVFLASDQISLAERFACWALGFLMLGITLALVAHTRVGTRLSQKLGLDFGSAMLIALVLLVVFLVGEPTRRSPRVEFYTNLQPNFLASRLKPDDLIITDSPHLNLDGIRTVGAHLNLDPDQRGLALWDDLSRALKDVRRVFWIMDPTTSRDTRKILATFLQANGCLAEVAQVGLPVRRYDIRAPLTRPRVIPAALVDQVADALAPAQIDWASIRVTGLAMTRQLCSHDALAITIRWQLPENPAPPLKVAWLVLDAQQRLIQAQDFFIMDSVQRQTNQWSPGSSVLADYVLPIPFATPPGTYMLALAIYPANSFQRLQIVHAEGIATVYPDFVVLDSFQVERPNDLQADPYKTISDPALSQVHVELSDGLWLDAYRVDPLQIMPGEDVRVVARWQSLSKVPRSVQMWARLRQDNRTIVEITRAPGDDLYPTDQWRVGEFVLDRFELSVPPTAGGGTARLEIGVEGGQILYAADLLISAVEHTFDLPRSMCPTRAIFSGVAELVGCAVKNESFTPNEQPQVILHWRASASPPIRRNYVVFVQLLALDGHVLAQSDMMPSNGLRPTRSWIKGEVIADPHLLRWIDRNYRGAAKWVIGLYDPTTLERVPVLGSMDLFVTLPDNAQIIAPK